MRIVTTIALKDLRLLARDRAGAVVAVVVPVLFALVFGSVFEADPARASLAVAVADEDGSDGSRKLVAELEALPGIDVTVTSTAGALEALRRSEVVGAVVVPEGFEQRLVRLLAGQPTPLVLHVDPTRRSEARMLEGALSQQVLDGLVADLSDVEVLRGYARSGERLVGAGLVSAPGSSEALRDALGALGTYLESVETPAAPTAAEPSAAWRPVRVAVPDDVATLAPASTYEVSFPQGAVWGLLACAALFAVSMVGEQRHGTLVRLRTAPISAAQVLIGKALACFTASLVVLAIIYTVGAIVADVAPRSLGFLLIVSLAVAFAFTGVMMALGAIGGTERSVGNLAWAVLVFMAMFGGGMVPLFLMPDWMLTVSHLSPVRWAVVALEAAFWRELGLAELALPLGALGLVGLLGIVGGAWLVARSTVARSTGQGSAA